MRLLFFLTKYTPVIGGIFLTLHCALLLNGIDEEVLKEFLSFGWQIGVVFTILSYRLHFCFVHRLNIWFDCLMDICIKAQRYNLFSEFDCDVYYFRLAMLTIGIIIQTLLLYKIYGCRKCTWDSRAGQCSGGTETNQSQQPMRME